MGRAPLRGQPEPWWLLPLLTHPRSGATPWERLERPQLALPRMWEVLMRKGILAGQWASCLTAGKVCLRGEEGCKWHEKSSLPSLHAACFRLVTVQQEGQEGRELGKAMGRSSPSFCPSFSLEQPTSSGLVLRPHCAPEVGLCPDMAAGASAQTGCFSWNLPHGAQFRTGVAAGLTGEESRVGEAGHPPT